MFSAIFLSFQNKNVNEVSGFTHNSDKKFNSEKKFEIKLFLEKYVDCG